MELIKKLLVVLICISMISSFWTHMQKRQRQIEFENAFAEKVYSGILQHLD